MKKQSNRQFAEALYEIIENLPKNKLPEAAKQFLIILQKNNKLKKIDYIMEEFINYSKKRDGIKTVEIESARKLERAALSKIKKIFGEKSEVKEMIDEKMLGGIKIKVDDLIYDAGIKKQLARLKQSLI